MSAVFIAKNDTSTCQAAAAFVAAKVYTKALAAPSPAEALDNICDALPEIMADLLHTMDISSEVSSTLHAELADRLWAFTAVEHARTEAGNGYGYIFDLLADGLKKGADPKAIRTDALAVPGRIRDLAGGSR